MAPFKAAAEVIVGFAIAIAVTTIANLPVEADRLVAWTTYWLVIRLIWLQHARA